MSGGHGTSPTLHNTPVYLPTDPPRPCPDLLTLDEVVKYLRLDVNGPKNPRQTVGYYRRRGLLKGIAVGKHIRFPLSEVQAFIKNKTQEEPR